MPKTYCAICLRMGILVRTDTACGHQNIGDRHMSFDEAKRIANIRFTKITHDCKKLLKKRENLRKAIEKEFNLEMRRMQ